ncbi:PREDICTED: kinesin-like protein KIN-7F [Theobroma cacao]|uniref:Kinesin-like protein KIN-7F n=1 Tax=Theobroma cacao TaxID=3641 RepID=A0AB32WS66_THECC|nr:PREDICTED: kinesin-like protein KIN-7F [Theobroma cacao]XP_017981164.1 PREDICTED: kinesin-like protein KIN-7F [Theobroma cacao]XP_017981165.1 PREDICTED: kinesin-like protein KIN-7F [Theobroma cacao]
MGTMSEEVEVQEQGLSGQEEKIFVSVRLRPLNEKDRARNSVSDWECINNDTIVFKNSLPERSMFPAAYTFDRVFACDSHTRQVYEEVAKQIALSVLSGINSTIFAYGQTSSGKTYTMSGITEYAVADIYDYIEMHEEREFLVKFSAMEIYNEAVRDLLSSDSTPLRLLDDPERGTVVEKLTEETLRDRDHLQELLSICEAQRQIGETSLNETSSRSHQILRLTVESSARDYAGAENSSMLAASVNFVDLAGSERASQTLSAGARLKEGCHINRSLLTLGTVIRKLSKGRNAHVPYRDSKLTRILQNSLGGNARTAIICTMNPARSHVEQSRNTLLFASCAKEVTTNAHVNLVMSDKALVKQLQRELARLENEMKSLGSASNKRDTAIMLREKELLIGQMAKEIAELTRQRDLAQSRVENLLLSVREVQMLKQGEYSSPKLSEPAKVPYMVDYNKHRNTSVPSVPSSYNHYLGLPENSEEYFLLDGSTPKFVGPDPCKGWEEIAHRTNEQFDDSCKEVRCIEIENSSIKMNEKAEVSSLSPANNEGKLATEDAIVQETETDELSIDPEEQERKSAMTETVVKEIEADDSSIAPEEKVGKVPKTEVILKKTGDGEFLTVPEDIEGKLTMMESSMEKLEADGFSTDPEENQGKLDIARVMNENVLPIVQKENLQSTPLYRDETYKALKQKIEELQRTVKFLVRIHHLEQSPCFSDASSSSTSSMTRSRSCKAVLATVPSSPCFEKAQQNESTPPSTGFDKDFFERPRGLDQKLSGLKYDNRSENMSRKNSQTSLSSVSGDAQSLKDSDVEDNCSVIDFLPRPEKSFSNDFVRRRTASSPDSVAGGIETKLQSEKQIGHDTAQETTDQTDNSREKIEDAMQLHSSWASEFEKQQRKIIELWDACNVPLIHRTYFILLFKGDPSDSVYMEVELRRLSFIKNSMSSGTNARTNSPLDTTSSSVKDLIRERGMLSKQIQKKFSRKQREELFKKWGIGLDTKQRSLQLARRVWTDTNDMDHVKESAALVAKLFGFVEPSRAPKEIVGLNILPRSITRRSYTWKHGIPPLL